ncbi:unnamed protein product [Diabrotica balteata]|uniref:Uncharacterized protein n=1 Tax=Diabrotica balteata TaxID=107213 RepID=A0A9N9T335_DIABA|nr:unnamed protein product [Diabrotica balteata]
MSERSKLILKKALLEPKSTEATPLETKRLKTSRNNLEPDFSKKEIKYLSLSANNDDVNLKVPNSDKIIVQEVPILQSLVETITQTKPSNLTEIVNNINIYDESSDDKNINEENIENAFGTRTNNLNVIVEEVPYVEEEYILPLANHTTMNNNYNDDSQEYLEDYFCNVKLSETDYTIPMKEYSLLKDISLCTARLKFHANCLMKNMSNNAGQYNNVIAKFLGGQRIN